MYDLYAYPKFEIDKIEFITSEISKDMLKKYFAEHGHITSKTARINHKFVDSHKNIEHIGITKTHIYLIIPYKHHTSDCQLFKATA